LVNLKRHTWKIMKTIKLLNALKFRKTYNLFYYYFTCNFYHPFRAVEFYKL